ncbi:hypothetical protein RCL_jg4292.t1 [Rhizophagus clarus]|uniref:Uncharacterized protein n=1 Tax=Rhizophagus clarus TaxID=94130 RepID=A0A8H3QC81_9GLOM|nr:hypothetical protein RCL_jg4292.t1 [Rhizophagus clarus]
MTCVYRYCNNVFKSSGRPEPLNFSHHEVYYYLKTLNSYKFDFSFFYFFNNLLAFIFKIKVFIYQKENTTIRQIPSCQRIF